MTLHIHRSRRADPLADALATVLRTPPSDVFAADIVVVPARGIERWLTQRLSHDLGSGPSGGDGICAGVQFLLPWQLSRQVLGIPRWDAWAPDRLLWPLLQVIDAALDEPWLATVATHLGREGESPTERHRRGRRFAVARRLARLFDSYASYRPMMLTAWADHADHDGYGQELPNDLQWQPELWRRLAARVEVPDPVSQLTRWQQEMQNRRPVELPERLSFFGPTRMTARDLQIVSTLSDHTEVHLWLPHPSPQLWQRLAGTVAAADADVLQRRREDRTILLPRNRLLSALGRDSRELQLAIGAVDATAMRKSDDLDHCENLDETDTSGRTASLDRVRIGKPTLLGLLQDAIASDRAAQENSAQVVAPTDTSIQVHACHGSIRQVEVLREVIVGLLADDDTLQPRDILVMCPDIDHYAPLIAATFGLAQAVPGAHPGQQLRAGVADRAISRTNPVVAALQRVLALVDGRAGATEILDLANMSPVRRCFSFSVDDMEQLGRWTAQAGVRWGLDPVHRSTFQMESVVQGTWRSGLDRILLGVTMADEGNNWLSVALPVDDVASSHIELAGRFAEFLDRIGGAVAAMAGEHTVKQWSGLLLTLLGDVTAVSETEQWQWDQLTGLLADIVDEAGSYAETTTMTVADIRRMLVSRLGPRPTRGNFRTGGLTFCTMVPMRSVPQRVICLLGLDDGVFPRAARQDGDDILARHPVIGERDVRGEDRQLMLDALLAATDTVAIIYSGNDERTGADRPPAVPVGELLDTLDEIAVTATGVPLRRQILRRHPLQPFDERNFQGATPFSFDRQDWLAAQERDSRRPATPFLAERLPPLPVLDVELAKLVRLLQYPARGFLEQRLQVTDPDQLTWRMDALPVELDSLQRWEVGDRLLAGRLAGHEVATCRQAEYRRGLLPPGPLGTEILDEIVGEVETLVQACAAMRSPDVQVVSIVAALDQPSAGLGAREVRGTVGLRGSSIVTVTYSKLSALHRLRTWIEVLALTAARPELPTNGTDGADRISGITGITVGRGSTGRAQQFTVGPVSPELATHLLTDLVRVYDAGLCAPLPMAARTSGAYAAARRDHAGVADAEHAADQHWVSNRFPGENGESAHRTVWGADAPLAALLAEFSDRTVESITGEPGESPTETTRFGELAIRVWLPLLANERVQWL